MREVGYFERGDRKREKGWAYLEAQENVLLNCETCLDSGKLQPQRKEKGLSFDI